MIRRHFLGLMETLSPPISPDNAVYIDLYIDYRLMKFSTRGSDKIRLCSESDPEQARLTI